jgi:hypothetical protein
MFLFSGFQARSCSMSRFSLIRRFTFAGRRSTPPARRPRSLPHLETLEDRTVLSTFLVSNLADSGAGSLRQAIINANTQPGADVVNFASNLHGTIILSSGELSITDSLTINGPGANHLTISGNNASRVFYVKSGNTLTLANLTIADGQASGPLEPSLVGVYSGGGTGAGGGGGILNEHGATLNLINDTVRDNQAVHGSSPLAFTVVGGGVLNLGTALVVGCTFSNNQATGGNAFDNLGGSGGGAIDNFGGAGGAASLTVASSTFSNNSVVSAGGNFYFGFGGALESNGGLNGFDPAQSQPSTAMVTNCTFRDNQATAGPGAIADGGAVVTEGIGVVMTLVGCTVSGNRAVGGDGGDGLTTGNSQGSGGGVCNVHATLNIMGCTITNNLAKAGDNSVLSDADPYDGAGFGGGIENNFFGVLNIADSSIANNVAQGGAMATGPGGDGVGGGISSSPSSTLNMTRCTVANNRAIAGQGGPGVNSLLTSALAGFAFGGGIEVSNASFGGPSTATIIDSQITGNSAIGGAGGTGNDGGNGYGGGLGVGFVTLVGVTDQAQLTLINSTVANNQAVGGKGGKGGDGGDGLGGGLCVTATCRATVINSSVTNNSANGGEEGAGSGASDGQGIGGGEYNQGSLTNILSSIKKNQASTSHKDIFSV